MASGSCFAGTLNYVQVQLGTWNGSNFVFNGAEWDWQSGFNGWAIGVTNPGSANPVLNSISSPGLTTAPYWLYMAQSGSGQAIRITLGYSTGALTEVYNSPSDAESNSAWTLVSGSGFTANLVAAPQSTFEKVGQLHGGYTPDGTQNWVVGINPAPVLFLGVDTVTGGNWTNRYGAGGFYIPNDPQSTPLNFTNLSFAQYFNYTWAGLTSDPRALQTSPGATTRIASAIVNYYGQSFYMNLNIYDTKPHTVSFYLLDWDGSRSETFTISDASTGQIYDTQTFSGLHNGVYAVWQLKGNLTIKVTPNSGPSAAVSGIFID